MAIQQVKEEEKKTLTPEQEKAREAKTCSEAMKLAWRKAGGKTPFMNRNKTR